MLAILSKDEEFIEDTLNKFHELIDPMLEDEEEGKFTGIPLWMAMESIA